VLAATGETDNIRLRHAEYLVALATRANLHTEDEGPMRHDLVIPETNNIRAALEWAIATDRQELGLRLVAALENWWVTTDPPESVLWIERLRALSSDVPPALSVLVYRCLGNAATVLRDRAGEEWYAKSLAAARAIGDERQAASVL